MAAEFQAIHSGGAAEEHNFRRERERLENERLKLLQAHYAGAVPLDLMKAEQDRIGNRLSAIERQINELTTRLADANTALNRALAYLTNLSSTYRSAADKTRRQINQAIFTRIEIEADGPTNGQHTGLYGGLLCPSIRTSAAAYQAVTDPPKQLRPSERRGKDDRTDPTKEGLIHAARRAGGVKEAQLAEGVGFEPTDSLLSSAFKALALGHYANPPERDPRDPTWPNSGRGRRGTGARTVPR